MHKDGKILFYDGTALGFVDHILDRNRPAGKLLKRPERMRELSNGDFKFRYVPVLDKARQAELTAHCKDAIRSALAERRRAARLRTGNERALNDLELGPRARRPER